MIRRLSTKWVLAVLAAVVVPFLGFAWFVNAQLAERLSWNVARHYLVSLAGDLAGRLDDLVEERRFDIELWAEDPLVEWALGDNAGKEVVFVRPLKERFDRFVSRGRAFDLLMVVNAEGEIVTHNSVNRLNEPIDAEALSRIESRNYLGEPWFARAMAGDRSAVDQHHIELLGMRRVDEASGKPAPSGYHVGFAEPVWGTGDPTLPVGVIYGLLNWSVVQDELEEPFGERDPFSGFIGAELRSSSYSWLWRDDANTIIAHKDRSLYDKRVKEDVGLPILVEAARAGDWDLFPEYEFRDDKKNAAFKHCADWDEGGLGWVVGIGINNDDISVTAEELSKLLISATAVVLLIVVLWTLFIARRTTQPILALEQGTRRVAAGDLDVRIEVKGQDELAELARAFNQMTEDLQSSREQLVRAEKEAAWKEMAQQVAHEIKNPLTPILLSTKLLRRAREEGSPELDEILTRTLELVERQVENMREIAQDFSDFAGSRALAPKWISVDDLIGDVLELESAWAEDLDVRVVREGEGGELMVDPDRLHRVLINLISNALEAMGTGGELLVRVGRSKDEVSIELLDEGSGLDETARQHLFEPHFTTKSHGTGLGLAICKRVVDEMGGSIELGPRPDGAGTRARVVLPVGEAPAEGAPGGAD